MSFIGNSARGDYGDIPGQYTCPICGAVWTYKTQKDACVRTHQHGKTCPICKGKGEQYGVRCTTCDGTGLVTT